MKITKLLYIFGVVFLLIPSLASAELSEERKRELSVELGKGYAIQELKNMAEVEAEIAKLPTAEKELALYIAASFLNRKLVAMREAKADRYTYTDQQFAKIMASAVVRLAGLAQTSSMPQAAQCHTNEAQVLTAIGQGRTVTPANCRQTVYGLETQSRYIAEINTPIGQSVSDLANRWAASATMFAYSINDIEQNGGLERPKSAVVSQPSSDSICGREAAPLKSYPPEMQEAVVLSISNDVVKKFLSVVTPEGTKPEDQLWGYKILAIGHHMLKDIPINSAKVHRILWDISSDTSQLIAGGIKFEEFREQLRKFGIQVNAISNINRDKKTAFLLENKKPIEALSRCVVNTAMYNAMPKHSQ